MDYLKELKEKIGLEVLENEPLKKYTTFQVGGPAEYFVVVKNKQDLKKALQAALDLDLKYYVLGGGSNLLISDQGLKGFVIKLQSEKLNIENSEVSVFAGLNLKYFVKKCVENNLTGLEFAGNIPGTVGGAIYGNAGAYGQGVGDFVDEVLVYKITENTKTQKHIIEKVLNKEECEFKYRESVFKKNKDWIIAEVKFNLEKNNQAKDTLEKINIEWKKRCASQPWGIPSAGCSFKNILYTPELEKFKDWEIKGKLPAAKFIDEAGLKGYKIGGAMVSDIHANFIINNNGATADEIMQLIAAVKSKVRDKFNVQLEEEVQYLGF